MDDGRRRQIETKLLQIAYGYALEVKDERTGCLRISPRLPKRVPQILLYVGPLSNDLGDARTIGLKYLPPVNLYYRFPLDYPSTDPPRFVLDCYWMSDEQLERVADRLRQLWDQTKSEILRVWALYLENDCFADLGLGDFAIDINEMPKLSSTPVDEMKYKKLEEFLKRYNSNPKLKQTPKSKGRTCASSADEQMKPGDHEEQKNPNDVFKHETRKEIKKKKDVEETAKREAHIYRTLAFRCKDTEQECIIRKPLRWQYDIIDRLEEYNELQLDFKFFKDYDDGVLELLCDICLTHYPGNQFVVVRRCRHYFCRECTVENLAKNMRGDWMACCMGGGCSSVMDNEQIINLVETPIYEKYKEFSLKRAVENDAWLTHCPRRDCNAIADILSTPTGNIAACDQCDYYFCVTCNRPYHGDLECNYDLIQHKKLIKMYREADASVKISMEERHGRKKLQKLLELDLCDEWLEVNSKKCPTCAASIQKIVGCNKIICTKCSVPFCWLCLVALDSRNPYEHFQNPNSSCNGRLIPNAGALDEINWEELYLEQLDNDEERNIWRNVLNGIGFP